MDANSDLRWLLKFYFNQDEFYPDQKEIIASVLSGKNVFAIIGNMPNKSVCYRIPALLVENKTLVITQSKRLDDINEIAPLTETYISSYDSSNEVREHLHGAFYGKYKIVYANPEKFQDKMFLFAMMNMPISLIVIENAQHISPLSHDFHPDFMNISRFIKELQTQPIIMAIADPCNPDIRDDIISRLELHNPEIFISDLSIPEISLEVIKVLNVVEKYNALESVISELSGQAIIYANNIQKTVEICDFIKKFEPKIECYHGGLSREKRYEIERDFNSYRLRIIVTTNSSNVSFDNSSISHIHFDIPNSLERYYRQISTAANAKCVIIYSHSDLQYHHRIIENELTSLPDVWRITETFGKYYKTKDSNTILLDHERQNKDITPKKWLDDHFQSLTHSAQKELTKLKRSYENLSDIDKNPLSNSEYDEYLKGSHWNEFRKNILAENKYCQICGHKSEQIHHLHYRTLGKEKNEDVIALCNKCHCFIHPDSSMTNNIFEKMLSIEKSQLKLLGDNKILYYPEIIKLYEQIEIETKLFKSKLKTSLRYMEIAGMIIVQPDCGISAKVTLHLSKEEMLSLAKDTLTQSVIRWLIKSGNNEQVSKEIEIDMDKLKDELSCSYEALENIFISLDYMSAISYEPIIKGLNIKLVDLDINRIEDTFESIKKVRYNALNKLEEYINTGECRQKFINEYFDSYIDNNCGKCDNCTKAHDKNYLDYSEISNYIRTVLSLVNKTEENLSKNALAEILSGHNKYTAKFGEWEEFGALSMLEIEDIILFIDLLIRHGLLDEENHQIRLTQKGFSSLNSGNLALALSLIGRFAENIGRFPFSEMPSTISKDTGISSVKQSSHSELSERDKAQIAILKCAGKTDGQIDRSDMLKILRGQKTKRIAKLDFDHLEEFSSLRNLTKDTVLRYIDELIESGCLKIGNLFFPKIQITDIGRRRLSKISK